MLHPKKSLKVHKIQEWLVLQEFYFLVEKTRFLLSSSICVEDMRESDVSLNEMISFVIKNVYKKNIEPDDLSDYLLIENYSKINKSDGYNQNYYSKLVNLYHSQVTIFNFIVDGSYKSFLKRNPNW